MRKLPTFAALAMLPLFVSASPPQEREMAPGVGVLCMGVLLYFAEEQGRRCHPGEDPDYQAQLANLTERFDIYLTRNMDGGADTLARFKEGQGLGVRDHAGVCERGEDYNFYAHFQPNFNERTVAYVDGLLARDGPPSWGDCL